MSRVRLLEVADAEELSRRAATEFVRRARGRRFSVALAGGSTPRRLYQLLADAPYREQVDWTQVEFFFGDERMVPPDHVDSNFRMAHEALLVPLDLPDRQIHRMAGERDDLDAAAAEYASEIGKVLGGTPPAFDLVLLGLGRDGHTASLFPSTSALSERRRWVVSNFVPQLDICRLTLTAPILNHASHLLILVAGADKRDALAAVLEGPRDPERFPCQLVRPDHGELLWLVDRAAAAGLSDAIKETLR